MTDLRPFWAGTNECLHYKPMNLSVEPLPFQAEADLEVATTSEVRPQHPAGSEPCPTIVESDDPVKASHPTLIRNFVCFIMTDD